MSVDEDVAPPAMLVIELPDGLQRVPLTGDATLGRDVLNDVPIDHPTVSRHHARIARVRNRWRFEDLGSRNGTRGGAKPGRPFDLADGAALRIGRVRAWFFSGAVPADWSPPESMPTGGKLVRCRCGHVGWAPSFVSGMAVKCRACKQPIAVEDDVAIAQTTATCAGCRDAVAVGQASHTCPSCAATMHAECYAELHGCATYGCERVNELAAKMEDDEAANAPMEIVEPTTDAPAAVGDDRWTIALLALVGLPLFGLPAYGWAMFAIGRRKPRGTVVAGVIAAVVGFAASAFLWSRVFATGGVPW